MMTTFHAAFHVLTASFVAPAARPTAPRVLAPPLMMALDASPFTFDGTSSVNGWHPQDRMMAPQGRFSPHEFSPHDMDMEMGSHMHYGRGRHMMPSLPHDMGGRYHQPPPYAMGGQYSPYDDTRMRMHMGGRHQQFGRERRMGYPRDRSGRMGASGEAPFTFDGTSSTAAWEEPHFGMDMDMDMDMGMGMHMGMGALPSHEYGRERMGMRMGPPPHHYANQY